MASEENPVVSAALSILRVYGVEAWRNQSTPVKGRRYNGRKGVSDVLGISAAGLLVAVECKRPGGKLRPEQVEFLNMVENRGGVAIVADSVDDVYHKIDEMSRKGKL